MTDVDALIDFWTTAFLNSYNTFHAHAGVYFYVSIAVIVVFPILRRMIRAIRGGR